MKPAVLFIVGAGRSGSTLLERLIADRGGVVAVGELRFLWERGVGQDQSCSCRMRFSECPFWGEVMAEVRRDVGGDERLASLAAARSRVDRNRYIPLMHLARLRSNDFERSYGDFASLTAALYASIARVSGNRLVLDSSKDPSYAHLLSTLPAIDVAFVNLVRDARAVAHSWRRPKARPEIHWERAEMDLWSCRKAATDWNTKYLVTGALKGVVGDRVLTLRYENLAQDPNSALTLIGQHLAKLGMDPAGLTVPMSTRAAKPPTPGEPCPTGPSLYHTVSGNPIRFESASPVVRVDDEWRASMPWRDRLAVAAITAPLLAHHRIAVARGFDNPR
jgi:hypothetical protein